MKYFYIIVLFCFNVAAGAATEIRDNENPNLPSNSVKSNDQSSIPPAAPKMDMTTLSEHSSAPTNATQDTAQNTKTDESQRPGQPNPTKDEARNAGTNESPLPEQPNPTKDEARNVGTDESQRPGQPNNPTTDETRNTETDADSATPKEAAADTDSTAPKKDAGNKKRRSILPRLFRPGSKSPASRSIPQNPTIDGSYAQPTSSTPENSGVPNLDREDIATERRAIEEVEKSRSSTPIPLEETAIGRAIIAGDKEAYIAALHDLKKGFHIDLMSILTKQTSDGKTLIELMIEVPKEKEYFAREVVHSLVTITHTKSSKPAIPSSLPTWDDVHLPDISTAPISVNNLIKKAKEADNQIAYQLLVDFQNLLTVFKTNSMEQKEQMLGLLQLSRYDTKLTSAGISVASAGILSVLGYALLSNANDVNILLSLLLPKEMLPTDGINLSDVKVAGTGALAIGLGLAIQGGRICQKAFRKIRQIKSIRQNINATRTNID